MQSTVGFPVALTEMSASGGLHNSLNAGAAVKKAAQQVENQAQILTTQLNNRVHFKVYYLTT